MTLSNASSLREDKPKTSGEREIMRVVFSNDLKHFSLYKNMEHMRGLFGCWLTLTNCPITQINSFSMNTYRNRMIFRSILHLSMRGIQEKYQLP